MKIRELVGAGVSEVLEVKWAIQLYITKVQQISQMKPIIQQIITYQITFTKPKSLLQLSKLDQENSGLKINEW